MKNIDIFNGDADGLCALLQLHHAQPRDTFELVTGVKRDIALVEKVSCQPDDIVTVLDISLEKNVAGLQRLLNQGNKILYIDHHFAGDIPHCDQLTAIINTSPETCTSLLTHGYLQDRFSEWAITGAFGDNLENAATALAKKAGLNTTQQQQLNKLGTYLNYNGYGSDLSDLHFAPAELFRLLLPFSNPLDFIAELPSVFNRLETGYRNDMSKAKGADVINDSAFTQTILLPNQTWARRVSGVYGNALANQNPNKAHAVLTEKENGNFLVSVRAPQNNKSGADDICRQFASGGGRKGAAGINDLPADKLDYFLQTLEQQYQR